MSGTIDTVDIQLFKETVWGTAGTPTVRLMGVSDAEFNPIADAKVIAQLKGSIGPGAVAARTQDGGEGKLSGWVTYEQTNYLLENMLGTVTPTGSGPYQRAGSAPLLASGLAPLKLSMVKGDADGAYALAGCLVNELTIKCEKGQDAETTFEAGIVGKSVATGTLGSLSDVAVNPVWAGDYAVYMDTIGGTPGATAVTATVKSYELKLKANRVMSRGLGSRSAFDYGQRRFNSDDQRLTLVLEFVAASKAYLDSIIGATLFQRIIRLKALNGTNVFQFDFGAQAVGAPKLYDDDDGIKTMTLEFQGIESTGLGNWFKYSTTSGLAVL